MSHKQTNTCLSLIGFFNLCDSPGSHCLQTQRGFFGACSIGQVARSGKLGGEKMGFLHALGASDRKVNGFMRLQWHIIANTSEQTNDLIVIWQNVAVVAACC